MSNSLMMKYGKISLVTLLAKCLK